MTFSQAEPYGQSATASVLRCLVCSRPGPVHPLQQPPASLIRSIESGGSRHFAL